MAKSNKIRILLKLSEEKYIYLANVAQADDGSIFVSALPSIQKEGKQARLKYNSEEVTVESEEDIVSQDRKRISYHTSGIVKYHGLEFKDRQFEPLYEINNNNVFLSLFLLMENEIPNKELKEDEEYTIIDVSNCKQGVFISFSIEPSYYHLKIQKDSFITFRFHLFELSIYLGYDDAIKKFLTHNNRDLGYFAVDNGVPVNNSPDVEYQAEIEYKKRLYRQKEAFVRQMDDTTFEIVFSVPMRCRPKFRIVFDNPEHKAFLAQMGEKDATKAHFRFFVRNPKGQKLKADSFKIINVELDAEIYEPEHVWESDWI